MNGSDYRDFGGMLEALVFAVCALAAFAIVAVLALTLELIFGFGWSFWRWVLGAAAVFAAGLAFGTRTGRRRP